jgi:hypothetical protein
VRTFATDRVVGTFLFSMQQSLWLVTHPPIGFGACSHFNLTASLMHFSYLLQHHICDVGTIFCGHSLAEPFANSSVPYISAFHEIIPTALCDHHSLKEIDNSVRTAIMSLQNCKLFTLSLLSSQTQSLLSSLLK